MHELGRDVDTPDVAWRPLPRWIALYSSEQRPAIRGKRERPDHIGSHIEREKQAPNTRRAFVDIQDLSSGTGIGDESTVRRRCKCGNRVIRMFHAEAEESIVDHF